MADTRVNFRNTEGACCCCCGLEYKSGRRVAAEWPPSFYGQLELVNPLQRSIEIEGLREDRFDMTHGGSGGTREGSGEPHEGSGVFDRCCMCGQKSEKLFFSKTPKNHIFRKK